jgi:hypothetical protein
MLMWGKSDSDLNDFDIDSNLAEFYRQYDYQASVASEKENSG